MATGAKVDQRRYWSVSIEHSKPSIAAAVAANAGLSAFSQLGSGET